MNIFCTRVMVEEALPIRGATVRRCPEGSPTVSQTTAAAWAMEPFDHLPVLIPSAAFDHFLGVVPAPALFM